MNISNPEDNDTPDLSPLADNLIRNAAPDEALHALLQELEETAEELRSELEERHGRKINPNVTPEQEEELEHFPEYWANSKGSWSNLFKLLREFRDEMGKGKKDA